MVSDSLSDDMFETREEMKMNDLAQIIGFKRMHIEMVKQITIGDGPLREFVRTHNQS